MKNYNDNDMSNQERIDYEVEKFDKQKAFEAITSMASYFHDEEDVKQLRLDMINYLFECDKKIIGYKIDGEDFLDKNVFHLKLIFEKTKEEKILEFLDLKYGGLSNITIDKDFIKDFYNEVIELKEKFEEEE